MLFSLLLFCHTSQMLPTSLCYFSSGKEWAVTRTIYAGGTMRRNERKESVLLPVLWCEFEIFTCSLGVESHLKHWWIISPTPPWNPLPLIMKQWCSQELHFLALKPINYPYHHPVQRPSWKTWLLFLTSPLLPVLCVIQPLRWLTYLSNRGDAALLPWYVNGESFSWLSTKH
jgi:hypothetical protein